MLEFFHFVGIIIMVGSVTVIDTFGFIARNSRLWTRNTIEAHYITKPLIWLGASIVTITWLIMLTRNPWTQTAMLKTIILPLLILNGSFLSFYISPKLTKLRGKDTILPIPLQRKIAVSFIISFILNWSFVFLSV